MSAKKIAVGLFCLAVMTAGVAEARKLKVKNLPVDLPGIDGGGAIDFGDTSPGFAKLSINLNTGLAVASAKGRVNNLSGARQVFTDPDLLGAFATLIRDKYVVNKNGKAEYSGRYQL
jgi:hypothetical protein